MAQPPAPVPRVVLPVDVWGAVSDFLRHPVLSQVCAQLRAALRHRHITLRNAFATTLQHRLDRVLEDKEAVHTLSLFFPDFLPSRHNSNPQYDVLPHVMQSLLQFTNLRALSLDLSRWQLSAAHLLLLARMHRNRRLQWLRLVLNATGMGDPEAEALARFRAALALETVELELKGNLQLRHEGAVSLASLGQLPSLTVLSLALQSTGIGTAGLQALAALKASPHLRALTLGFEYCTMKPEAFPVLAELAQAPALHTLTLKATGSSITADGVQSLSGLSQSLSLRTLILHLNSNHLQADCGRALAKFASAPRLRTLQLQLGCNSLGDDGVVELAAFRHTASITAIALDLSHNVVTSHGAQALAQLAQSTTLRALHLVLAHNRISHAGVRALGALDWAAFPCRIVW